MSAPRSWSIGEVARLLGVKPHVLRYWEGELPLLTPRKGATGRRVYTPGDIRLLLRFRWLIYEKRYTIEGASRRLWEEIGSGDPDLAARFAAVRAELVDALLALRRGKGEGEGEDMAERALIERATAAGQAHLFAHWGDRPQRMREKLLHDLEGLDWGLVEQLRSTLPASGAAPAPAAALETGLGLEPAPHVPLRASAGDREALAAGEEEIRRGRTALLTVAGGQGSRLGFEGPKGMYPVTPIRGLTLFALFAEKLLAARRWYGARIPWLLMTSPQNHEATEEYFRSQDWFGLGEDTVRLFVQGVVPTLSPEGKLLLAADGGLFFNPGGHGGVIDALRTSGALEALRAQGVDHVFYFQVDNPLVRVPDPLFLGFHLRARSRFSAKVVAKAYAGEKIGVAVARDGVPQVVEYSDLPPALMEATGPGGGLLYSQGSIAIHLLDTAFLADPALRLPWHVARKKATVLNPVPGGVDTVEGDAVKMEMFVFDAIPLAGRAMFFETDRAEEFAPLKNREGPDSIATCRDGQVEQASRWLASCGVEVPRDARGRPRHVVEISPLFAMDPAVLSARRGLLKDRIDEDTLLA